MSHRHQTHVVVPAHPRPRLVLRHPEIALGVLEVILDGVPCAGHFRQDPDRRRDIGVADVILDLGRRIERPSHQQPDRRPGLAVTHRPDTDRGELERQRPFRSLADLQGLPRLAAQARRDLDDRGHRFPARNGRHSTSATVRWDTRPGVLGPDGRSNRHLDHVPQPQLFHLVEELAVAAVLFVGRDPIQGHHAQQEGHPDQPGGDLGLGLEGDPLGDLNLLATLPALLGVFAPTRGQVELMVQHRRASRGHAHEEDPDTAVVLLAQSAVVLPVHPGVPVMALLGEATLVDHPDRAHRAWRPR